MNHPHEHPTEGTHTHTHPTKPHGRKLHRDWRLWAMVLLMLAAMAVYLLTLDLR
jgi:hypothetical protein